MNAPRDPDRRIHAWLELMPDEAPDRVIAAVDQAVERMPQVRQPFGLALWRPANMNNVKYAAAAVAIAIIGVVGLSLGGGKAAPTTGASAPPSAGTSPIAVVPPSPSKLPLQPGVTAVANNVVLAGDTRYTVPAFTPAFTFTGHAGWLVFASESAELAVLVDSRPNLRGFLGSVLALKAGEVNVMRVGQVLEPGGQHGGAPAALPGDVVAWLQARPDLVLEAPSTMQVSGIDATVLRGTVRAEAVDATLPVLTVACEAATPLCSPIEQKSGAVRGLNLWAGPGSGFEIVALKVQGQQLLIGLSAGQDWDTVRPDLEAFLAGITFTSPAG